MIQSLNGKLILEPYKGEKKVKPKVVSGFAGVAQKQNLVGLTLLQDALVPMGMNLQLLYKGTKIYILEEILTTHAWGRKTYESSGIKGEFILGEISAVSFTDDTEVTYET